MKIALLARNPKLYSHRRICEAARARGHEIEVVNTLRVSINITSQRPALYYRKRRIEDFDAVIPRIGASITFYGLAVLRQFEMMGIYPLNEVGRHRPQPRQAPLPAASRAARHWASGNGLHQRSEAGRGRDRRSSAARRSSSSCSKARKASA